jgi:DNA invertase Pin-like site-specific DNA recombinase
MHVGWIRVSDDAQAGADRYGIPRQRAEIIATAKALGVPTNGPNWRWYQVEDVCGAHVMYASETKEVIELALRGELESIFAAEPSRLARPDKVKAFEFIAVLQDARCKVHVPGMTYDLTNRTHVFMFCTLLNVAGLERGLIHDRTVGSKEQARKAGRYLGGRRLAFGMLYDRKRGWSYDPENGPKVREAFERVYGGDLNMPGLAKRLGLSLYGVRYILRNPIYTGFAESKWEVPADWMRSGKYGKSHPGGRRSTQVRRQEPIRVQAFGLENTDPLVSQELFNAVQRILDARIDNCRRESQRNMALYNGFVFCDRCGALLSPEFSKRLNRVYYACRNYRRRGGCDRTRMRAEVLEANVDRLLMHQLTDRSYLARLAMTMENNDRSSQCRKRAEQIESELRGIDKKRFHFEEMCADGLLTRTRLAEHLAKLGGQQAELEKELSKCRESILPTFDAEQLVQMFEQFAGWDTLTREERRSILAVTIPRLKIEAGEVVEFYRLLDNATVQTGANAGVIKGRNKNTSSTQNTGRPSRHCDGRSARPDR